MHLTCAEHRFVPFVPATSRKSSQNRPQSLARSSRNRVAFLLLSILVGEPSPQKRGEKGHVAGGPSLGFSQLCFSCGLPRVPLLRMVPRPLLGAQLPFRPPVVEEVEAQPTDQRAQAPQEEVLDMAHMGVAQN